MEEITRINHLEYENLDMMIKGSVRRSASEVVRLGFFLRRMMDERLYLAEYTRFDEYLEKELHMDYTAASRFININKKYSVNGKSEDIDERYKWYSQGLLVEMLSMPPELEGQITPDMPVRKAREIKREARQKDIKAKPDVRGVMSYAYCAVCGAGLDDDEQPDRCPECGQLQDWDWYNRTFWPEKPAGVATSQEQVNTGSEIELREEIIVGIEADEDEDSDQEELSVEFDTGELLNDLDDVIDAEYREVDATASQGPVLVKPDSEQCRYLDAFAKHFINSQFDWMLVDYQNRVLNVMNSPGEIKAHLPANCRHWFFRYNDGAASIDLFDDCVQLWDEKNECMGNFEWFYLAAAIQSMWNVVSLERAESKRMDTDTGDVPEEETGVATSQQIPGESSNEDQEPADELRRIRGILEKEKKMLSEYLEFGDIPEPTVFRQKIIVGALANMLCGLEAEEEKEPAAEVQQELPTLKNNDQRKQWLSEYKNWGLWYRDENIDINYYKFDFPDGSRLVAAEYPQRLCYWRDERTDEHYFHFLEKNRQGYKTKYDEQYRQQTDSETYLVEYLKNLQKKGAQNE